MTVNVIGVVAIAVFYILVAITGIWAARRNKNRKSATETETMILGGKDIGLCLGICTMTASWIGGGAVNGTAEALYDPSLGLLWTIGPIAYGLSLILNGLFFAEKMRDGNYMTSLDPIQAKLGIYLGVVFFTNELVSVVLYISSILTAIGATLEVVIGLPRVLSVIISAVISTAYTVIGGLYSVAYTDVLQLFLMVTGVILAIPFALTNAAVTSIAESAHGEQSWLGKWDPNSTGEYIDTWLLVIFGGIPVQSIQQRILSADTTKHVKIVCLVAGLNCILFTVPPALLGVAGTSANWSMTEYMNGSGISPTDLGEEKSILPIVLQYLTPPVVAFFGLGAVSAAVMSSIDSECLAEAGLFGKNTYKAIIRKKATDREVVWVIRLTVIIIAVAATTVSLYVNSITTLYILCSDLMYVLTFPQFLSVLYLNPNAYGSIAALIIGVVLRVCAGEALFQWPSLFSFAGWTNLPFKTIAMLSSFLTLNVISFLARVLFEKGYIPEKYDILQSNLAHGGRTRYLNDRKDHKDVGAELESLSLGRQDDKEIKL